MVAQNVTDVRARATLARRCNAHCNDKSRRLLRNTGAVQRTPTRRRNMHEGASVTVTRLVLVVMLIAVFVIAARALWAIRAAERRHRRSR
jgi:hypothetical protein